MEDTMATKKAKAPKKSAPAAKKGKTPKEELCVFAFRLTPAERNAIHKRAGAAKASRFVRRVAAAFAKEDERAFREVLKEARETRKALD